MTKKELIAVLADKTGNTKVAMTEIVDLALATIVKEMKKKDGVVDLAGFGKFSVKKVAARNGVNPATGEKVKIAATKKPVFKAAKALKEAVK